MQVYPEFVVKKRLLLLLFLPSDCMQCNAQYSHEKDVCLSVCLSNEWIVTKRKRLNASRYDYILCMIFRMFSLCVSSSTCILYVSANKRPFLCWKGL